MQNKSVNSGVDSESSVLFNVLVNNNLNKRMVCFMTLSVKETI